jgi:hypothetical protein
MENFVSYILLYFLHLKEPEILLEKLEPVVYQAEIFNGDFNFYLKDCAVSIKSRTNSGVTILSSCNTW